MIWYFQKDLKSLMKVEVEKRGLELDSFEEIVEKVVDAKVKTVLRPRFYICETN